MIEKLVLASGNQGKLREFSQLFADKNIQVIPQDEFETIEGSELFGQPRARYDLVARVVRPCANRHNDDS